MRQMANSRKIKELRDIIDAFVIRQKNLNRLIYESKDIEYKNNLDVERQTNTAILRICYWVMMELKGCSFERKIKSDADYPLWITRLYTYYCNELMADIFEFDYKSPCKFNSYRSIKTMTQKTIFYLIYNKLFPEVKKSIFDFNEDKNIENEVWRTRFSTLISDEWVKYRKRHM